MYLANLLVVRLQCLPCLSLRQRLSRQRLHIRGYRRCHFHDRFPVSRRLFERGAFGERFECGAVETACRFALFVRSPSHSKARSNSISSVKRQRQLPSGWPGTFIRPSLPRFNTSWRGAIATAATEVQANSMNACAATPLLIPRPFKEAQTRSCWSAANSSNQPRVVGLSCVPVYATVFVTKFSGRYGLSE